MAASHRREAFLTAATTASRRIQADRPRVSLRRPTFHARQTIRCSLTDLNPSTSGNDEPPAPQGPKTSREDVLLGELMFTHPDELPKLVELRMEQLDEEFYRFVNDKIADSDDLEERDNLRTFLEALTAIMGELGQAAAAAVAADEPVSDPAAAAQSGYDKLLQQILSSSDGIRTAVATNYDRMDNRFLETLSAARSADPGNSDLEAVQNAVSEEMQARVRRAMDRLKMVLQAGSPEEMERQLVIVASRGWVDEPFILLLAGNIDQASKTDPNSPVIGILKRLQDKALELRDSNMEPEVALIRRLLRTEDKAGRKAVLVDALTPGSQIALADGKSSSGVQVSGKKFVGALRKLIKDFGNLDDGKFVDKLSEIGEESEEVAHEVFGVEQKDLKELQDDAFHKRSISVWELEKVEMQHELEGTTAPWEDQTKSMGFDEQGKKLV